MTARARAARPWLITAAVITLLVCAVPWPRVTGWAVGCAVGTVALVAGVRQLRAELRHPAPRDCPSCDARIEHTEHCPTPETHNWGCGCPSDQTRLDPATVRTPPAPAGPTWAVLADAIAKLPPPPVTHPASDLRTSIATALITRIKLATTPGPVPPWGGQVGSLLAATEYDLADAVLPIVAEQRAAAYRECADLLRDAHYRDGLTVQEIGTALRNTADHMEQQ